MSRRLPYSLNGSSERTSVSRPQTYVLSESQGTRSPSLPPPSTETEKLGSWEGGTGKRTGPGVPVGCPRSPLLTLGRFPRHNTTHPPHPRPTSGTFTPGTLGSGKGSDRGTPSRRVWAPSPRPGHRVPSSDVALSTTVSDPRRDLWFHGLRLNSLPEPIPGPVTGRWLVGVKTKRL